MASHQTEDFSISFRNESEGRVGHYVGQTSASHRRFGDRTKAGEMRHPVYPGLRTDKRAGGRA